MITRVVQLPLRVWVQIFKNSYGLYPEPENRAWWDRLCSPKMLSEEGFQTLQDIYLQQQQAEMTPLRKLLDGCRQNLPNELQRRIFSFLDDCSLRRVLMTLSRKQEIEAVGRSHKGRTLFVHNWIPRKLDLETCGRLYWQTIPILGIPYLASITDRPPEDSDGTWNVTDIPTPILRVQFMLATHGLRAVRFHSDRGGKSDWLGDTDPKYGQTIFHGGFERENRHVKHLRVFGDVSLTRKLAPLRISSLTQHRINYFV